MFGSYRASSASSSHSHRTATFTVESFASSKSSLICNGNDDERNSAWCSLPPIQQDYLLGIETLRKTLAELDCERCQIERDFYASVSSNVGNTSSNSVQQAQFLRRDDLHLRTDQRYNEQLRIIHQCLVEAVSIDRDAAESIQLERTVDSERLLIVLINRLQEKTEPSSERTSNAKQLIRFYNSLNNAVESIRNAHERLEEQVLSKVKSICTSFSGAIQVRNVTVDQYTHETVAFRNRIGVDSQQLRSLAASYTTSLKTDLYSTNQPRIEHLVSGCDTKKFPIVRLFPELSDRLQRLLIVAYEWLARDEMFLHELNREIGEARSRSNVIQQSIAEGRERQRELAKALRSAHLMMRNSSSRIHSLETDLTELHEQAHQYRMQRQVKQQQIHRKSGFTDFLLAGSGSQTKSRARQALQFKQMRLVKQLEELNQMLNLLDGELTKVEHLIDSKSVEMETLHKRQADSAMAYDMCRKQFTQFFDRVSALEQQLSVVQRDLNEAKTIRDFKTSPDVIDDFYEGPTSIKLSQSLQRRLGEKRKVMLQPL